MKRWFKTGMAGWVLAALLMAVAGGCSCATVPADGHRSSRSEVAPDNFFSANTADSAITTAVTSLSQYRYGVAKICVDGRRFYIDKQGNEVGDLNDLSFIEDLPIADKKPLLAYQSIEKVDDVLILQSDGHIQCVDLNNGTTIYQTETKSDYDRYLYVTEERGGDEWGHDIDLRGMGNTILGNGQRAIIIGNGNVEETAIVNVDTKEVLAVDCFYDEISEGLYRYRQNGMIGFKDVYNQVVIPATHPASSRQTLFDHGLALLQKSAASDKIFAFYDRQGNEVLAVTLDYQDEIFPFREGLAKIGRSYWYGYIDITGAVAIEPQYTHATGFSNGVAIVAKNGRYGVIYNNNQAAIPLEYDSMKSAVPWFSELNADTYELTTNFPMLAQKGGKWGYVSFPRTVRVMASPGQEGYSYKLLESETVVPFIYDEPPLKDFSTFTAGQSYQHNDDGEPDLGDISHAIFRQDDKLYAVAPWGEVLTPEGYARIGDYNYNHEFVNGMLAVAQEAATGWEQDRRLGFVNTRFELVIPLRYSAIAYDEDGRSRGADKYFAEDVACVAKGEKLILIDRVGNELLYFN